MLKLKDVFVVFNTGTLQEKAALRGINFEIQSGEIITIVGNHGAGKSTLLRLLAGYFQPNFGRIWIDHQDITNQDIEERSKRFAFVSCNHEGGAANNLTVAENLAIAGMHHQSRSIFSKAINDEMLETYFEQLKRLDFYAMENVLHEKVCNISPLHKFVLSLLIAATKNVEMLLIDVGIIGFAKEERESLIEVMGKIIESQKLTSVIAIDDPAFALSIAERTLVLSQGQIVADLSGDVKKKTEVEDLFASFKIIPKIKDVKPSSL